MEKGTDPEERFTLVQVNASNWAVHDRHYPEHDHRRVVCMIFAETTDGVETLWRRDLPLPTRYATATDVLQAVRGFHYTSRATRPIAIPHLPPSRGLRRRGL